MSDQNDDDDKQFEASQKKLDDARKKGEIAKSADLTTAAAYAGFLLIMATFGPPALLKLSTVMSVLLLRADEMSRVAFSGSLSPLFGGVFLQVFSGVWLWFAAPATGAILSIMAQRAFVVAPTKIKPKPNRISPLEGIKNKFGRQGLFEFAKSFSKLLIYSIVMGAFLVSQSDKIFGSVALSPAMILAELGWMLIQLVGIVLIVAAVLGGIDFLWQRAEHARKNRMSRKEMMEELKQSEGDPIMKQQRRQKGQQIAMNKMLADVPHTDVIIVNPTHYAVALKWERSTGTAPVCVAKGVDEIAAKIRELAHEHAIPVHSDPPTARALHSGVQIGAEIKPEHYRAVAAAIRFAESIRKRARER
ncbi:EscU/YscU/HrcU family type III secretion system export apparatus switch protein [Yoonia sediminilitoris]|uniref:Flagellar biosynthetic protein FlhB n=1 Tax=Yoonia sediminilitoris TaxID=1286148 RepID=A0A2T6KN17_9RHOB|nr:flagellar type III secretion system protein FlhB [Yoonia sediminilitoris]PUB17620.1 flagellar biosynthetic protein FlhB [Yoonia sediminilitoris]RCW97915.1 flagellar biosynthetic protein FlhB [Yoonia sediminilitoris]